MLSILQEMKEKIKAIVQDRAIFSAFVVVLVAIASFGLGRQSVSYEENVEIIPETKTLHAPIASPIVADVEVRYVASKNGTVYHLPHCSGAKRISDANKRFFSSKEDAEAAGLRPAANCKGI